MGWCLSKLRTTRIIKIISGIAPFYPSKSQYRSAIFYSSDEQLTAAQRKIDELSKGGGDNTKR